MIWWAILIMVAYLAVRWLFGQILWAAIGAQIGGLPPDAPARSSAPDSGPEEPRAPLPPAKVRR